jgi:hypothetical protein
MEQNNNQTHYLINLDLCLKQGFENLTLSRKKTSTLGCQ